jgi:hypothetical protein
MENIELISERIKYLMKLSLEEKRYRFGLAGKSGISNKIASGNLYQSIDVDTILDDGIYIYMDEYSRFVQSGRLPGEKGVPISVLEKWIKDRGLSGKNKKGKKISDRSFAFAIQTNIKKFGIPTQPGIYDVFFDKLFNDQETLELLGDVTVEELIDKIQGI